ncbi:unnamed protein product [Allacma fusca]|uniref:Uncharacterized protein n=1 Tax=Allacma fusca TaxID=39272 RepID=A0A8J2LBB9_9HEXA|nr:unnamed protein product [Allacma fusca]
MQAVLMRFRKPVVGIMGDIKEMFQHIRIVAADQNSQRFLWRGMEREKVPDVYIMEAVIFNAACSPSSVLYVKNVNAAEYESEFPVIVEAIKSGMYMDDLLNGEDDAVKATQMIKDFVELFRRGGMQICNWASSSKQVVKNIPPELRAKGLRNFDTNSELAVERALVVNWCPEQDEFKFNTIYHKIETDIVTGVKNPTKTEVLQLIMPVIDPLGFVAHFAVKAKILFQQLWLSTIGWDKQLQENQIASRKKWLLKLEEITVLTIPRCYSTNLKMAGDVFPDASVWPKEKLVEVKLPEEEMRRCVGVVAVREPFGCPRFPSWMRAVRTNSWICRFITEDTSFNYSLKRKGAPVVTSELTVAELERSEHIIFKAVQRESFAGEIAGLRQRKP